MDRLARTGGNTAVNNGGISSARYLGTAIARNANGVTTTAAGRIQPRQPPRANNHAGVRSQVASRQPAPSGRTLHQAGTLIANIKYVQPDAIMPRTAEKTAANRRRLTTNDVSWATAKVEKRTSHAISAFKATLRFVTSEMARWIGWLRAIEIHSL